MHYFSYTLSTGKYEVQPIKRLTRWNAHRFEQAGLAGNGTRPDSGALTFINA